MSSQYNDSDDDLPLHTRGRAETYPREVHDEVPEREVTLNTGVVLGIFFALALLCAVFFGFGYSIGHKSAPAPVAAADTSGTQADDGAATPAPKVSTAPQVIPQYVPSPGSKVTTKPSAASTLPTDKLPASSTSAATAAAPHPAPVVRTESAPTPEAAPPAASAGTIYVQVAAVSHQEDADVLQNALKRRGYAVHVRNDPSDKLLHVQVGPFSTRKEAEAMRQRLSGDGYNGYIK